MKPGLACSGGASSQFKNTSNPGFISARAACPPKLLCSVKQERPPVLHWRRRHPLAGCRDRGSFGANRSPRITTRRHLHSSQTTLEPPPAWRLMDKAGNSSVRQKRGRTCIMNDIPACAARMHNGLSAPLLGSGSPMPHHPSCSGDFGTRRVSTNNNPATTSPKALQNIQPD